MRALRRTEFINDFPDFLSATRSREMISLAGSVGRRSWLRGRKTVPKREGRDEKSTLGQRTEIFKRHSNQEEMEKRNFASKFEKKKEAKHLKIIHAERSR